LVSEYGSKKVRFNKIWANDVAFLPEENAAEETYQKCLDAKPLDPKEAAIFKAWLTEAISQIEAIPVGTPRRRVGQRLELNGGFSMPSASIYSHADCRYLKVRIEFEYKLDDENRAQFDDNDKVKAISMPYLGLFITG
jgi:hypothetical protein